MMNPARILIVGDEPILLATRAELLREWHVSSAASGSASEAVQSAAYDLVIICQTIPDVVARTLIAEAREISPNVLLLAMSQVDQERNLGVERFEVQLSDPDRLRRVVVSLLQSTSLPSRLA